MNWIGIWEITYTNNVSEVVDVRDFKVDGYGHTMLLFLLDGRVVNWQNVLTMKQAV